MKLARTVCFMAQVNGKCGFPKLRENLYDYQCNQDVYAGEFRLTEGSFDSLLMDSIDEAFSTLGDSAKQSIYFHLRTKFGIDKKDIPKHVDRFENGLEKIFGAGSRFLEIIIMKKLYEKIHNPLELNETNKLMFADYVASARKGFKTSRQ